MRKMFSVLNVSAEKISDKMIKSVDDRVTSVSKYSKASIEELAEALQRGFTKDKEFEMGELTKEELARANELANSVYSKDAWNFSR